MAKTTPSPAILFLTFLLLITPPPSQSLPYSQYRTLFSLAHSLMTRVANLRASRGDHAGSDRARNIAAKMESGLGLGVWGFMWSAGWDYVKNYSWRELPYTEMYGAASEAGELMRWLGELTRKESDSERAAWIGQNYQNVFRVSASLLRRLLRVFSQSTHKLAGNDTSRHGATLPHKPNRCRCRPHELAGDDLEAWRDRHRSKRCRYIPHKLTGDDLEAWRDLHDKVVMVSGSSTRPST